MQTHSPPPYWQLWVGRISPPVSPLCLSSPPRMRLDSQLLHSEAFSTYQSQGLGKQWHLVPGRIGHSHRHPHALNSKHLSAGIHPVTAEHSHSTKGTCIIALITLTLDKHALVKAGFSMKESVHQGPGRSTPCQISCPRGFTPPERWYRQLHHDGTWQHLSGSYVPSSVNRRP
jgi:hypothetical protein